MYNDLGPQVGEFWRNGVCSSLQLAWSAEQLDQFKELVQSSFDERAKFG